MTSKLIPVDLSEFGLPSHSCRCYNSVAVITSSCCCYSIRTVSGPASKTRRFPVDQQLLLQALALHTYLPSIHLVTLGKVDRDSVAYSACCFSRSVVLRARITPEGSYVPSRVHRSVPRGRRMRIDRESFKPSSQAPMFRSAFPTLYCWLLPFST